MSNPDLSALQSREYAYDLEKHWDQLLSGDEIDESRVRSIVTESWQRCKNHGIDPAKATAPPGIIDSSEHPSIGNKRMRSIIRNSLKTVSHYLEETQSVLIGTDRAGQLFFVEGDDRLTDNLADNAVTIGASWDESKIGTNAIGTALKLKRNVLIHGHEHFCVAGKQWSCAADVIRDPVDHSILGVVDLTGPAESIALRASALISALVERIESELAKLDLIDQLTLIEFYHDRPSNDEGLLMVDRRGKVIRRNGWKGLNHAQLEQGGFVPGLQGLTPDHWTLDLTHEAIRDGEIEWVHSGDEVIGAAIHFRRFKAPKKAVQIPKPLQQLVDVCPSQESLVQQAAILTNSEVPILVTGETGVGKEILSSAIHQSGDRVNKPFVVVNCSAIPHDLIGVELFGYVEGAFTGARRGGMSGRIEDADGGTLFLDEIGDMPLETQPYLLRALETGKVSRIGESKSRDINVRIIAATHQPLEELVHKGDFRSDLFYRLNVARLHITPLRNRPSDIIPLGRSILSQICKKDGAPALSKKITDFLLTYDFPGNIRELKSLMQRYALGLPINEKESIGSSIPDQPATLADIERNAILDAMLRQNGSVEKVAAELDIPRSTLYRRLAQMQRQGDD